MKQYNLLIADDEYYIRQRLKRIINWPSGPFQLIGEATDGNQVLTFATQHSIDILLLDIRMPLVDGLSVCHYFEQNHPTSQIIILTGFDDFTYAQKALKLGVKDYLLKPVRPDVLNQSLIKCCRNLDYLENNRQHPKTDHHLIISCYSQKKDPIQHLKQALKNYHLKIDKTSLHTYLLYVYCQHTHDYSTIHQLCHQLTEKFAFYLCLSPLITDLSSEAEGLLIDCCKQRLSNRYFSNQRLLFSACYRPDYPGLKHDLFDLRKKIVFCLNRHQTEKIVRLLDQLFIHIKANGTVNYLQLIVTELLLTLTLYHHKGRLSINSEVQRLINDCPNLDQLKHYLTEQFLYCLNHHQSVPSDIRLTKEVMNYLDKHYHEKSLTIKSLAKTFNHHPSYLGSLFKKTTKQSITDYLTYLRIKDAKKLLISGDWRVSEVANKVGYSDVFYFSKRFKAIVGCSPKEFINLSSEKSL